MIVSVHQIHTKNNMQSSRIVPSVVVKLHRPHLLQKENNPSMNLKILLGRIIHIYENITALVESIGLSFNKMEPALFVLMCLWPWTDKDLSVGCFTHF